MTITFKKKPRNECDQNAGNEASEPRQGLSANRKRALRRERINAAKNGIIIPYEPRSRPPVDPNAPKLTNTGKRMARKRKKYAAEMAELGFTVDEGGPTYFKPEKKKKKNQSAGEPSTDIPNQPDEEPTEPEKKKRRKQNKKKKNAPSINAAGNLLEENTSDKSLPEEEIKIKVENDSSNEEILASEEGILPVTPHPDKVKIEKPGRKQRFILFVGNLSYDITEKQIRTHFAKVGKIVSIRISKHVDKSMQGKSKGFAHLEVADEESYLKALSMHHSMLDDRRINVEYSSVQTKDIRVTQKERTRAMKKAMASGDILDFANPSKLKSKKNNQTEKRQKKQVASHKVWL